MALSSSCPHVSLGRLIVAAWVLRELFSMAEPSGMDGGTDCRVYWPRFQRLSSCQKAVFRARRGPRARRLWSEASELYSVRRRSSFRLGWGRLF